MEQNVNYYSFAENDYHYLKASMDAGFISNGMASLAQNIVEKYLKHIIDQYYSESDISSILRTHSLRRLLRFLETHVKDFDIDESLIIPADGYYFSARYPGEDSFFVDQKDIDICWLAVEEAKTAVDCYLEKHSDVPGNQMVLKEAISYFID